MLPRVRVEQLGTNPTPDECPNMLFSFNDYFVCPEILAYRCIVLINGFKASPVLQTWPEGDWFQSVLRSAYPANCQLLLEEKHSSSRTTGSTFNSYTDFTNAFDADLTTTTNGSQHVESSQEISQLFHICKSLIETLDTPEDNLCTFLQDIMRTSATANSRKMHRFRVKTRILLQGFQVFVSQSPHSDDAKHECLLRTLWVLFWRCYQLLQASARLCTNGDTTVRSWRHIPALVSGVLIRGFETSLSKFASIVSPLKGKSRKRTESSRNGNGKRSRDVNNDDDDDDVDDIRDEFSRINLSTECVPYALWLSNQLENVNYYRLASHNSLFVAAKQGKRNENNVSKFWSTSVARGGDGMRGVHAQFGRMLRALRSYNFCELVNTFFEGVQQGNVLIQEYVYKYLSTLPRVIQVSGNSFTVDRRTVEITAHNYDKIYELYVTLKARSSRIIFESEEKASTLNIKAAALTARESPESRQYIIDALLGLAAKSGVVSDECNDNDDDETKIIKLIRNVGVLRSYTQKHQAALLTTKMILMLCRSWSQGYVEGYKVLPAEQLRAHTKFMKQKICHLCEPVNILCTRLVEHLDAIYEDTSLVTMPIAIALGVLSHVENEVKQVLSESVTLVMERTKIAKDIKSTLEKRRSKCDDAAVENNDKSVKNLLFS